ncbi:MAG: hypothetical protein R3B06_04820 [Kofleriaceae bacterium]
MSATAPAPPQTRDDQGVLTTTVTLPGSSAAATASIDPVRRRLTVGDQAVEVEVDEFDWTDDGVGTVSNGMVDSLLTLAAVDLDPRTPGQQLHIAQHVGSDDESTTRHQLVALVDGKLKVVWSWLEYGFGEPPVTFPGDGTIRHIENAWEACHRLYDLVKPKAADEETWNRTRAPIGELVWTFDAAAGTVTPAPLRKTKLRTDDCNLSG